MKVAHACRMVGAAVGEACANGWFYFVTDDASSTEVSPDDPERAEWPQFEPAPKAGEQLTLDASALVPSPRRHRGWTTWSPRW